MEETACRLLMYDFQSKTIHLNKNRHSKQAFWTKE